MSSDVIPEILGFSLYLQLYLSGHSVYRISFNTEDALNCNFYILQHRICLCKAFYTFTIACHWPIKYATKQMIGKQTNQQHFIINYFYFGRQCQTMHI